LGCSNAFVRRHRRSPSDSREFDALDSTGADGSGSGLLVQPSNIAYGPITLEFVASARFLVENAGSTTLDAPAVSLQSSGAGAFTLTRNDCMGALEGGRIARWRRPFARAT
jgi:hypothetical protein